MNNQPTPTLEQAARKLRVLYYHVFQMKWSAETDDILSSIDDLLTVIQQLRAARASQDKPRNTMSALCKRDLHRECDDTTYCACGCHLKPAVYTR